MDANVGAEFILFVRDRETGRLVFNADAIRALGLSPIELQQRGYGLSNDIASPALAPESEQVAG
jgi:hypothetical protein